MDDAIAFIQDVSVEHRILVLIRLGFLAPQLICAPFRFSVIRRLKLAAMPQPFMWSLKDL